ncbi:MAG: 6,7-dimethyl-8-ribityllumazine synthase [Alphaproteobacteria bacterium]|nr:6,7-dimethyl-8-ribityllumazine synthase [Alphaproteobacteria bacterium]
MSDQPHVMIAVSRYYDDIAEQLLRGATQVLDDAGATHEMFEIPGAFEIPAAIATAMRSPEFSGGRRRFDGYIALGCVIRGETTHYDYVCSEAARGLQDLAVRHCLALGFGILTTENREQAMARAAVDQGNKGADAANACLRMVEFKRFFRMFPR